MKNMREKMIVLVMTSALICGLSGCGGGSPSTEDVSSNNIEDALVEEVATEENTSEDVSVEVTSGISIGADYKIVEGYTLEETGSFEYSGNYGSMGGAAVLIDDNDVCSIIASDGSLITGVVSCDYIGKDLFVFSNSSTEVNSWGLYDTDGEEMIPYEVASISWLNSEVSYNDVPEVQRYLKVIYSTGETTDEDEAFFYSTDSAMSLSPGEGDTLYTGYAKLYDTEKQQFVDGIEITNPDSYATMACGNSFVMEDEDGIARLYDSDGNMLLEREGLQDVGYGYVIFYDRDADIYDVYDETGALRYKSEDALSLNAFSSTSGYMKKYDYDGTYIIDIEGNQVLADSYETYYSECYGLFDVSGDGDSQQIINLNNEVLATADTIVDIIPGYYRFSNEDGTYTLVGPDGTIAEDVEDIEDMVIMDGTSALVINDKSYSLALESDSKMNLITGMVSSWSDEAGRYGVFDLFTGTQLLDYSYSRVNYIPGGPDYLYAIQDDVWTIYKIIPVYAE